MGGTTAEADLMGGEAGSDCSDAVFSGINPVWLDDWVGVGDDNGTKPLRSIEESEIAAEDFGSSDALGMLCRCAK